MKLRVACLQLNTRQDEAAALEAASRLLEQAADAGADVVALPESWAYKGDRAGILAHAEPVEGPCNRALAELAARRGVALLAGSVYEPSPEPGRVFNTSALFGPDGRLLAAYRKTHLFDAVAGGREYHESDVLSAGGEIVTADLDGATVGLTICYDLRFPELYRALALRGAEVFFVPAAFTASTGAAHWHVLLRARAIENGAFVVAPDQVGEHLPGRACYGHSLVVDPWGTVLAEVEGGPGFCVAEIDLARVAEVRAQLPVLRHRRPELYGL